MQRALVRYGIRGVNAQALPLQFDLDILLSSRHDAVTADTFSAALSGGAMHFPETEWM